MGLFSNKKSELKLPAVFTQVDDPINYNSVLDYLVGLSDVEYKKMTQSAVVYRKANKEVAEIVGVENTPTTTITATKPTDEEIEKGLDDALSQDFIAEDEPEVAKPTKPQASSKKIEIKE